MSIPNQDLHDDSLKDERHETEAGGDPKEPVVYTLEVQDLLLGTTSNVH